MITSGDKIDTKEYDPIQSPPDFRLVEIHYKANTVGLINFESTETCACCGLISDIKELPLCSNIRDISYIGNGYILYFSLIVYVAILLGLEFVVSLTQSYENYDRNACATYDGRYLCQNDILTKISVANYGLEFPLRNRVTDAIYLVIAYLFIAVFKNKLTVQAAVVDMETDTASDFSIMVSHLPKSATKEEITNFFKKEFDVTIVKVTLAYNVEHLTHLIHEQEFIESKLHHNQQHEGESPSFKEKITNNQTKLDKLNHEIKEIRESFHKNHKDHFTGIAYISFRFMADADKVTDKYEMGNTAWFLNGCKYKLKYHDQKIRIEKAPEATEVLWQNLHYTFRQQVNRKLITLSVSVLILAASFGIIFGLKYLNYKAKKAYKHKVEETVDSNNKIVYYVPPLETGEMTSLVLISVAIAIVSKIVNKIFTKIMIKLTDVEKRYNIAQFNVSCVKKTVTAQFVNTSLLIVIVHYILNKDYRFYIWGNGGLLTDIIVILIFNAAIQPLFYLFNFGHLIKAFQKCKLYGNKGKNYTQKQAHKIVEGAQMNAVGCYTDVYQMFLTSMFFVEALPVNTLIHFLGIIVIYWGEKYYLLRKFAMPKLLQSQICMDTVFILKAGEFTNSAGKLYFDLILRGNVHTFTIIQFIITGVLLVVPIEDVFLSLYQYTSVEAIIKKDVTYEKISSKFISEYYRENPATEYKTAKQQHKPLINIGQTAEVEIKEGDQSRIPLKHKNSHENVKDDIAVKSVSANKTTSVANTKLSQIQPITSSVGPYMK